MPGPLSQPSADSSPGGGAREVPNSTKEEFFMASNYTTNYNLCQWQPTDQVQRADFNADNLKIDTALADLEASKADQADLDTLNSTVQQLQLDVTKIVFGSYSGNGAASRTITLGFTPKALLVIPRTGQISINSIHPELYGGLSYTGHDASCSAGTLLSIVENGFTVYYNRTETYFIHSNSSGMVYYYIAFI